MRNCTSAVGGRTICPVLDAQNCPILMREIVGFADARRMCLEESKAQVCALPACRHIRDRGAKKMPS